jgi:hypothetical protein
MAGTGDGRFLRNVGNCPSGYKVSHARTKFFNFLEAEPETMLKIFVLCLIASRR